MLPPTNMGILFLFVGDFQLSIKVARGLSTSRRQYCHQRTLEFASCSWVTLLFSGFFHRNVREPSRISSSPHILSLNFEFIGPPAYFCVVTGKPMGLLISTGYNLSKFSFYR